jgi:diadenosine tetraphosphate (Ap4A) HIT family hydrolase
MGEVIYAPLRKNYHNKRNENCPFCNFKNKKLLVYEGNTAYIVANKFPYSYGHLLVIPKRHITDIVDLNKDEDKDMMLLMKRSVKFLEKAIKCKGFNIGLNQGEYSSHSQDHLHFHVVPRYENDTGFMQITAKTSIAAENPEELVKKLKRSNQL